jgi:hypothetical protein
VAATQRGAWPLGLRYVGPLYTVNDHLHDAAAHEDLRVYTSAESEQ